MRKIMQKLTIKKKKFFVLLMALSTFLFWGNIRAFAVSKDEIARILYENSKFLSQNNWLKDGFRYLEWLLIKFLTWVSNEVQYLYGMSLGMGDFTSWKGVKDWIKVLETGCAAIMALSLVWFGVTLIFNHQKKSNIVHSIILAVLCVSGLTSILTKVNSAVVAFCYEQKPDKIGNTVLRNNFYDLVYIDNNFGLETLDTSSSENLVSYRYPDDVDIDAIDINEVVNYDSSQISSAASDILKKQGYYYYGYVPGEGYNYDLTDVYNGWGWNSGDDDDWFNEFYYRYHVEGFPVIITDIATIVLFICISYKTTRVFLEIPIKKILAMYYSQDLTGTQKTMKILGSIKDSYIILMVCSICIKLFYLWQQYLSEKYADLPFEYCIFLIFGTFALIDGPVLVQALTGEDAGLQSGAQRVMSAYQGAKGAAHTAGRAASNVVHGAMGIASAYIGHRRYKNLKKALSGEDNKSNTAAGKKNIPDGKDSNGSNEDILKDIGKDRTKDEASNPKDISQEKGEKDNHNQDIQDSNLEGQEERDIEEGAEKKESALNEFDPSGEEKRNTNDDLREAINDEIEKENSYEKEEDVGNEKNRQIDNLPETDLTKDAGSKNILKNVEKDRTKDSNLEGMEKRDIGKDRIQNEFSNSKDILQEKVEKDNLNKELRDGNLDGMEKRDIGESESKKPIIDGKENLN